MVGETTKDETWYGYITVGKSARIAWAWDGLSTELGWVVAGTDHRAVDRLGRGLVRMLSDQVSSVEPAYDHETGTWTLRGRCPKECAQRLTNLRDRLL